MKFDDLIECTRCGSDAAYVQEVTKDIKIEWCFGCGFQSNSLMKKGTDFFHEQFELLPELYKALLDEEEDTGKIWMPSTVNNPIKGMVFAEGTGRDNWAWAAVQSKEIPEGEKEKHKGLTHKADMSTKKHFPEKEYMDALEYIGIFSE